jgi:uncharacterized membrane protein YphA (DoxX/SURF4 family)
MTRRVRAFLYVPYIVLALLVLLSPYVSSAHEVYVLSPETIANDIATPSQNPLLAILNHEMQVVLWGFVVLVAVLTIFFASITHRLEEFFAPYFVHMRPHAPLVARVTLGVCLMFSGYHAALFGPELPLGTDMWAKLMQATLFVSGALITLGVAVRPAALAAGAVFAFGVATWGSYMLNYANYLGEIVVVFMLAAVATRKRLEPYAFLALRVAFGVSVVYAAVYAKFWYSNLAISTVYQYQLTNYFHFDPLFIVMGACIIEILMGIFFIIGFEIRHTALFFLFWIFLSLLYFGESVWPHLVLVGVNLALFMYGYDKWTVEGRFFNRGRLQPFL